MTGISLYIVNRRKERKERTCMDEKETEDKIDRGDKYRCDHAVTYFNVSDKNRTINIQRKEKNHEI
jgi:hypothetical protein